MQNLGHTLGPAPTAVTTAAPDELTSSVIASDAPGDRSASAPTPGAHADVEIKASVEVERPAPRPRSFPTAASIVVLLVAAVAGAVWWRPWSPRDPSTPTSLSAPGPSQPAAPPAVREGPTAPGPRPDRDAARPDGSAITSTPSDAEHELASPTPEPPVDTAKRAWLGLHIEQLTEQRVNELGTPNARGVRIVSVLPNSPAERAGLRAGDLVSRFARTPIDAMEDLPRRVATLAVGQTVSIETLRDGKPHSTRVTLRVMPDRR